MPYIDIHSHTSYSDGTSTVENSLRSAQAAGLSIFSVSDHNTVDAYGEIREKRELFEGAILPAVELNTTYKGEVIEILGYGIDIPVMQKLLRENVLSFADKQRQEAKLNTEVLLQKGVVLSDAFAEAMCHHPETLFDLKRGGNRIVLQQEMLRFATNARFFKSEEEFRTINRHRFTRDYLFNPHSTLYVDQSSLFPSLEQVIGWIHQAGGLAFLAHAFIYAPSIVASLDDITASYALDGLECHYGTFTKEQKAFMDEYCLQKGLFRSGGSDSHGLDFRPENHMGYSAGERIEQDLIEPWLDKVRASLI